MISRYLKKRRRRCRRVQRGMKEDEPADTSTLDSDCDFAIFEMFALLDSFELRFRFGDP